MAVAEELGELVALALAFVEELELGELVAPALVWVEEPELGELVVLALVYALALAEVEELAYGRFPSSP